PCPREQEPQPHTRAMSTNWENKRAEIMAKPPPTGGERGVFYPISIATELAAGYWYTTHPHGKAERRSAWQEMSGDKGVGTRPLCLCSRIHAIKELGHHEVRSRISRGQRNREYVEIYGAF